MITCPPVPIWNGLVSTESDISVRSVINVTCTNDTAITGDGADQGFVISTCTQSGTWEPELPECVVSQSKAHNAMSYQTSIRLEQDNIIHKRISSRLHKFINIITYIYACES